MDPQQLQQYIAQFNNAMTAGGAAGAVNQFQGSGNYDTLFGQGMARAWANGPLQTALQQPQVSLPQFFNSSAYQLAYGNNPSASSMDPNERFQNDPGVQAAIRAGAPLIANSYGQQGLGASGRAANGVAQYMYNNYNNFLQNQESLYQNEYQKGLTEQQQAVGTYLNQQQLMGNAFTNYQNQLAQLGTQNGTNLTTQQAQNQFTGGQNLAQLLANLNQSTGGALASGQLSTSAIISQLLANQGVLNANAFLGTGAAQSNNVLAGSQLGAQLGGASGLFQAPNAAQTNSLLNGANSVPSGKLGTYF